MSETPPIEADYFSSLYNQSRVNACILMDARGDIQSVNQAFSDYFGYTNEDLKGKSFAVLFTKEDRENRKPENEIKTALATGQCDDKNFFVHKDASITWVSGESILIQHSNGQPSLLKVIQDIHQQKESELSLLRVNDFNESILNAIDDFVILLDKSMQVIKYNPAFEKLFDSRSLLPLNDFSAFIRPFDSRGELQEKIREVFRSGRPFTKQVVEIIVASGERVFEINCQAIFSGQQTVALITGHDVTMYKRAEMEREDLMGFVAHELRNPLASIMMGNDLLTMMINGGQPEELKSLLQKNKMNAARLNTMVAELYDAAKIAGGSFLLNVAPFDFDEMLQETVDTYRILHANYVFSVEGKARMQLNGDRYRIQQVLGNYLSNAVKYANQEPAIIITVSTSDKNLTVSVKDHGPGIVPAQLPYLFDRFFRAEKTRNLEGIGLGLYLCRRIIHAHKGKVWAESEEGSGAVFYFSLPLSV